MTINTCVYSIVSAESFVIEFEGHTLIVTPDAPTDSMGVQDVTSELDSLSAGVDEEDKPTGLKRKAGEGGMLID